MNSFSSEQLLSDVPLLVDDENLYTVPFVGLKISIDGKPLPYYQSFNLKQSTSGHHWFELKLSQDALDHLEGNELDLIQSLIGKPIRVTFFYKNLLAAQNFSRDFVGIVTDLELADHVHDAESWVIKGSSPTILLDTNVGTQRFGGRTAVQLKMIAESILHEVLADQYACHVDPVYPHAMPYSCQYEETYYNYLTRIAQAYGEHFFYDGIKIYFGKLPVQEKPIVLTQGKELQSIYVSMKLKPVRQNAYGYSSEDHQILSLDQAVIHYAYAFSESIYRLSEDTFRVPAQQVSSIKDAIPQTITTAHKSALARAAIETFIISGITTTPFLYPGCLIDVYRVDAHQVRSAYAIRLMVSKVDHALDAQGVYTGSFEAVLAGLGCLPKAQGEMPIAKVQVATVIDNKDPMGLGRVQVDFDWPERDHTSNWLFVTSPGAGASKQVEKNRGWLTVPEIGDQVLIDFIHAHPDSPFVAGSLFHGRVGAGGGSDNLIKGLGSKQGHALQLHDKKGLALRDKTHQNQLLLDGKGHAKTISLQTMDVTNAHAGLTLKKGTVTIRADQVEFSNSCVIASKIEMQSLESAFLGVLSTKMQSPMCIRLHAQKTTEVAATAAVEVKAITKVIKAKAETDFHGQGINLNHLVGLSLGEIERLKVVHPITYQQELMLSVNMNSPFVSHLISKIPDFEGKDKNLLERAILFVNGYRFLKTKDSDNLISKVDRHKYWDGIDRKFMSSLRTYKTYYADGHHGIETSNHRSVGSFLDSALWIALDVQDITYHKSRELTKIQQDSLARTSEYTGVPISEIPKYVLDTKLLVGKRLNTIPNVAGFNKRRKNGKEAGLRFVKMFNEVNAREKRISGPEMKVVDIVAHSMGYAYALGMVDVFKEAKLPIGRFYVIAPENAISGKIDLNLFEEVWQYGSNLGESNEDPIHLQDGVAPQTPLSGLEDKRSFIKGKRGRAFIPKDVPKGFKASHSISNYTWIFKIKKEDEGYVKPRK